MTDDDQKKKDALARIREKAKSMPGRSIMGLLSGMLAAVDAEHDAEDDDLDDFLVALVSRNGPGETIAVEHLQFYVVMCKSFVGPALRRLAEAGRIRAITAADGTTTYLAAKESMQ